MITRQLPATLFLLISLLLLSVNLQAQRVTFNRYDSLRGDHSPLRDHWDVTSYDLSLTIDIEKQEIGGYCDIHYSVLQDFNKMQVDLFSIYTVDSIVSNNKKLSFQRDSNFLFVQAGPQHQSSSGQLRVYYHGKPLNAPKAPWDGGFVWQKDSIGNPWVGVACEGLGASSWWPCKDLPSDEPDSVTLRFTVPAKLMCVANGNLYATSPRELNDKQYKEWIWKVSYPINLYNVTLNIADYVQIHDTYKSKVDGSILDLDYYVLRYNSEKARKHFAQVKPMLDCYEKLFGKYPFYKDGYALVETHYWGMEHQSAIAYGNQFRNNIGDWDYIIIHESGHEWWGNSVSCTDHAYLWIHESFCTYSEALLVECSYGPQAYLKYLELNRKRFSNNEPILGPSRVNFNYWEDSDMYYKGAWILHTLRTIINDDKLWFSILKGIQDKYRLAVVSSDEIIAYINSRTGQNFDLFFQQYLQHKNIPEVEFYVKKQKGKHLLYYKLNADVAELQLPLTFDTEQNNTLCVVAKQQWNSIEITKLQAKTIRFRSEYYLVKERKLINNPK